MSDRPWESVCATVQAEFALHPDLLVYLRDEWLCKRWRGMWIGSSRPLLNPAEIFLNILKNILLDGKRMTGVIHTIKITTGLPNNSASITRSCTFRLFTRLIRLLSSGATVMRELTPKREHVDAC